MLNEVDRLTSPGSQSLVLGNSFFEIAHRRVGAKEPCFIIAEVGVNHNGDEGLAKELIDVAVAAGTDAVKFQTFRADALVSVAAPQAGYQKKNTGVDQSQLAMLKKLELLPEAFGRLSEYCALKGVIFLSSPFDTESADLLESIGIAAYKIPSGEISNLPFLQHIARKGKPIVLSTGMSTMEEVAQAVMTIRVSGNPPLALLHCVSAYPADPTDVNLLAMNSMKEEFEVPVGYSDHTLGLAVPWAAVALGACILEKHITLNCELPGPDHRASLEPAGLVELVKGVRIIESSRGDGRKVPAASEYDTASVARKSVVAASDIPMGTRITPQMLTVKRPGNGISPALLETLVGRTANVDIKIDTVLSLEMLQ